MASRIDCFAEVPSHIFGEKLKQQVEDRLKFYETGDFPKKNIEVMKEALEEYENQIKLEKKKKKKKRKAAEIDNTVNGEVNGDESIEQPKKKRKKSESVSNNAEIDTSQLNGSVDDGGEAPKKKKKKKKHQQDE